jgi:hypothetical protein
MNATLPVPLAWWAPVRADDARRDDVRPERVGDGLLSTWPSGLATLPSATAGAD